MVCSMEKVTLWAGLIYPKIQPSECYYVVVCIYKLIDEYTSPYLFE